MNIPGSWQLVLCLTLALLIIGGVAALLVKRPNQRPRIRVGLDAGWRAHDERDSLALFRRIMCEKRTRLGF
jgi:hypothetical protein